MSWDYLIGCVLIGAGLAGAADGADGWYAAASAAAFTLGLILFVDARIERRR